MVNGFEEETAPLSDYERDVVLPFLVDGLSKKIGKEKAVKSDHVIRIAEKREIQLTGPRFRKVVNHIRVNNLVPFLVATSKGYYVENDIQEIEKYIQSLEQRSNAILEVKKSLERQLWEKKQHA
jgi:hypothetical protein